MSKNMEPKMIDKKSFVEGRGMRKGDPIGSGYSYQANDVTRTRGKN
jgi:hypothetical protein